MHKSIKIISSDRAVPALDYLLYYITGWLPKGWSEFLFLLLIIPFGNQWTNYTWPKMEVYNVLSFNFLKRSPFIRKILRALITPRITLDNSIVYVVLAQKRSTNFKLKWNSGQKWQSHIYIAHLLKTQRNLYQNKQDFRFWHQNLWVVQIHN